MGQEPGVPRTTRLWRIAAVWLVACLCGLAWWAAHYGGWIGAAGEWQFGRFGSYFPALTLAALLLLLGLPAALAAWSRARWRRDEGARRTVLAIERTRATVARWRRLFGIVAVAGAALMLAVLLSIPGLPRGGGDPIVVTDAAATPGEGLAVVRGRWEPGRVARLDEDYVFARRTLWVAPVGFAGVTDAPVRLLTTLLPDADGRLHPIARGVLVRRGLPLELRNLYARAGVTVARDAGVLMRDAGAVRWRSVVLAVQMALLALVAGIGWAVLRRQGRRIEALVARATPGYLE